MSCCCGTGITLEDPRFAELDGFMATCKSQPGALISVLHKAQQLFGYLPEQVEAHIARGLGIPLVEVYGVVTFYNYFNTQPVGKFAISVCMGTACYVRGGGRILERLQQELGVAPGNVTPDGLFSLEVCRCVGACSLAPAVVVAGEVRHMSEHDVPPVLAELRQRAALEAEQAPALARREPA
ncbi:MAG TPA: NAD(P)H-dependent oxidoreductase subunit E [Symbiobacteriaceae bacterium]|nr:NAD(P)H-dependent oxidoreductase subunit E [Symbiobacteriaceae bacterium]